MMLPEEINIINAATEIWNTALKIEPQHPDERYELKEAIHRIQNVIAYRVVQRMHPDTFPINRNHKNWQERMNEEKAKQG